VNRLPMAPRGVAPGWYPLCLEKELRARPRRYVLGGLPLVAARLAGDIIVLLDRCPHRNVPLSRGRVLGETLECPYHGWRFDRAGHCTLIPGRAEPPKASHAAVSYPTRTHQGMLFVGIDVTDGSGPFSTNEQRDPAYIRFVRKVTLQAAPLLVVENALDVPHTGVLHRGLFRTASRRAVRVICRRYTSWIEAEYVGESAPAGLLGRLLRGGQDSEGTVVHFDRFFLPGVLQVEYRLGRDAHLVIVGYTKQIDDDRSELFAHVSIKTPLWRWVERLLLLVIEPIAWLIVRQDLNMLKAQADNVRHFGESRFMSTELDVLYAGLARLFKEAQAASPANYPVAQPEDEPAREVTEITMEI